MAKCHRSAAVSSSGDVNIGSLLLDHHSQHRRRSDHLRLWRSSFRRILIDALSCGGSSHSCDEGAALPPQRSSASSSAAAPALLKASPPAAPPRQRTGKSEKLSDLLSVAEAEIESETKKKVEALEELKAVVRDLQLEEEDEETRRRRREAARRVRSLAKEDSHARVTLAMLGAIPPLVGMIDSGGSEEDETTDVGRNDGVECRVASLYALLNLGTGNDANKAAIVKAGALHKMLKIIDSPKAPEPCVTEAIVANFLGLSALDSNKPIIGSSGAIPFLVNFLKNMGRSQSSSQARNDALRALYNLSIYPRNISFVLDTDLIPFLMSTLGDMEASERILLILSNVVPMPEGRKAISSVVDAFPILVDVLNWTDSPGCQEKVSYILMVMAHKAYGDRQAMIDAGVVSALLELTLLGSTLAQKRASRILECLRVDKGKQVSENYLSVAVSAPIYGSSSSTNPGMISKACLEESEDMMSDEKKAVKQLVQQSLQTNMRRIVKRANLPQDFVPSEHFKSLTASSTSKSLPF